MLLLFPLSEALDLSGKVGRANAEALRRNMSTTVPSRNAEREDDNHIHIGIYCLLIPDFTKDFPDF